jgi:hypothetical protein
MSFDYTSTDLPIPDRITDAHRRAWDRLARPGLWWTGLQRVAIAAEVRAAEDCQLCADRKDALSAPSIRGDHTAASDLPAPAIEAIHKIVTDPGRLSREWLTSLLGDELTDAAYVELVGLLTTTISVDDINRGLGLPLEPLPTPEPGDPERRRPTGATDEGSWLPTVPPDRLDPEDAQMYGGAPGAANVIRALSLVPPAVAQLADLHGAHYLSYEEMRLAEGLDRTLTRPQLELVAARVSAVNECFY